MTAKISHLLTVSGTFNEDTSRQESHKRYTTKKETRQAKIETKNRKQARKLKYATS